MLKLPTALFQLVVAVCLFLACGSPEVEAAATRPDLSAAQVVNVPADEQDGVSAQAQDGVPAEVSAAFQKKYPGATVEAWSRDRNDNFEARFQENGVVLRADFSPAGAWIETERSVKWDDLPKAVQAAIEREYDKKDIVELEFTQNADRGDFYDIELDPKGKKKLDIEFRADGSKV